MSTRWTPTHHNDGHLRLVGSIGRPTGLWSSPRIYNAAFQTLGLNWRFVPLPVPNGRLREALLGIRALGFAGAELTEPYQRDALNYVDEPSPAAKAIGGVKFVTIDERGRLVGANIHWLGFLAVLRALVPSLNVLRPLIIGAGNAAQSIVYALTRTGLPLTIVDERLDQAIDLVHRLRRVLNEHSFSLYRWPHDLEQAASGANLIINTTSLGAWPAVDCSPWPDDLPIPPGSFVCDLVPWPNETRFLRHARTCGARTVSGLSLLVYEAALAFEMWTGRQRPIELMWQVVEEIFKFERRVTAAFSAAAD